MAKRLILYLSADEHYLYRAERTALELEGKFSADEAGLNAFREYLRSAQGALFAVLADLAGEDFHEEQIPYLRGADREALLARRLAQRYRDTRLAAALSLGQVLTPERRNERLLLASFTNTQQLSQWLDALEEAGARLAGVYSTALVAPALAAALGARDARVLVVSANHAGLRQCYLENGRLRFARLERIGELAPEALAGFVRSETQRLLQYLITLRALAREAGPMQVLVIAPPGQRAAFEQALHADGRLTFRTIDYADALRALKLRRLPEGAAAEALFVHLAAQKPPRQQFANRDERRRYLLWQLQRAIVGAGAAAFCLCALVGGSRSLDVINVRTATAEQRELARSAAQQYQRITSSFPVTDTSTENLKAAVVEFRRIAERSSNPEPAFIHISRVLQKYPQVELDALRWSVGKPGEVRLPTARTQPQGAGEPVDTMVLVEISGRVNATQRNDYRGITAQVQSFASALVGAGYELVRTQLPFDVTSEGVLSGDIGGSAESGEAPRFTVLLGRRLR
ncbi:MAG: hypothetical protein E6H63_06910 [Betaproteobacteria bacterium]|nr:MAG: hypothetical protein E6H63_06910 [Betaproteobacteria bacterium]